MFADDGASIQLTSPDDYQVGSVWYTDRVYILRDWETEFIYSITDGTSPPADGLAFVIQTTGTTALGGTGGEIGYGGISNSIAICAVSYVTNAITIRENGDYTNYAMFSTMNVVGTHTIRIIYKHSINLLKIYFDETSLFNYTYNFETSMRDLINGTAYIGFTGSCGGANARQKILYWNFLEWLAKDNVNWIF